MPVGLGTQPVTIATHIFMAQIQPRSGPILNPNRIFPIKLFQTRLFQIK